MPKSASRILRAAISENKRWVEESEVMLQQDLDWIGTELPSDVSLQKLNVLATVLSRMAFYHGRLGSSKVIEVDNSGWQSIFLSIAYYFWVIKIRSRVVFNTAFLRPI